jgi:hypothetical protein
LSRRISCLVPYVGSRGVRCPPGRLCIRLLSAYPMLPLQFWQASKQHIFDSLRTACKKASRYCSGRVCVTSLVVDVEVYVQASRRNETRHLHHFPLTNPSKAWSFSGGLLHVRYAGYALASSSAESTTFFAPHFSNSFHPIPITSQTSSSTSCRSLFMDTYGLPYYSVC